VEYVAKFQEVEGALCRFDTRIYLWSHNPSKDSVCVGAIVGKNPGSAMPSRLGELAPLELRGDKMLPTVGNRFMEAYAIAKKPLPQNSYVRVWNLFYICDKDLKQAAGIASQLAHQPICESEANTVPFVWFGWGGNNATLNPFKQRFVERGYRSAFFYDHTCGKVIGRAPEQNDFAKHTQGMPAAPIREYLASVV
jgi:hypothetical protein